MLAPLLAFSLGLILGFLAAFFCLLALVEKAIVGTMKNLGYKRKS